MEDGNVVRNGDVQGLQALATGAGNFQVMVGS